MEHLKTVEMKGIEVFCIDQRCSRPSLLCSDAVVFEAESESRFSTVDRLEQLYTFGPLPLKECYLIHALKHRGPIYLIVLIFITLCSKFCFRP